MAPQASVQVATIIEEARERGIEIADLADGTIEAVADAKAPQGCISVARRRTWSLEEVETLGLVLVIDQIQDPGNVGAIIRVAEGCSAGAVLVTAGSADPFGPKSLRAATGSTFKLPVVEMGMIDEVIDSLEKRSVRVFATSSHEGEDFATVDWPESVALVLGNEGAGLDAATLERCDSTITIPTAGQIESLNVSVAAGILAMAAWRKLSASEHHAAPSTMNVVQPEERP